MAVDTFNTEQFQNALPINKNTGKPMWSYGGVQKGEHIYYVETSQPDVKILVRSSIKSRSGLSADCGQDSIRAYLVLEDGTPLGSKVNRWTTRVPGWEERLTEVLRTLYGWTQKAGRCSCGSPKGVYKVKKSGPNKGRVFANCPQKDNKCQNQFVWLTETK